MTWKEMINCRPWLPKASKGWHKHPNGGGWVKNTACVADTALISDGCLVYDEIYFREKGWRRRDGCHEIAG